MNNNFVEKFKRAQNVNHTSNDKEDLVPTPHQFQPPPPYREIPFHGKIKFIMNAKIGDLIGKATSLEGHQLTVTASYMEDPNSQGNLCAYSMTGNVHDDVSGTDLGFTVTGGKRFRHNRLIVIPNFRQKAANNITFGCEISLGVDIDNPIVNQRDFSCEIIGNGHVPK